MQAAVLAQQPGAGQSIGGSAAGARLDFGGLASAFGSAEGAQGAGSSGTNLGSCSMHSARLSSFAAGSAPSAAAGRGVHLAGLAVGGTPRQRGATLDLPSLVSPFPGLAAAQAQAVGGAAAPTPTTEIPTKFGFEFVADLWRHSEMDSYSILILRLIHIYQL